MAALIASVTDPEEPRPDTRLEVHDLTFKRRGRRKLGPLSLYVNSGEIVGMLGPNGAGKTTLLRLITGKLKPAAGKIIFQDVAVNRLNRSARAALGLHFCAQKNGTFRAHRSGLEAVAAVITKYQPRLVLLDEPFQGAPPLGRQAVLALMKVCRDHGCSVLIADHDVRHSLGFVDRAYVMHAGQILAGGTPDFLTGA